MTKKEKQTLKKIIYVVSFIVLLIITVAQQYNSYVESKTLEENVIVEEKELELNDDLENQIKIYFFDVGQADSALLVSKNETLLIDAGTNETGKDVVKNIENLGIKKLDYVIGTHPHEDHIGGLDDVINNFEIGKVYMPKVKANTKTFEDVLDAVANKNLKISSPKEGEKFNVGDIECEILQCGVGTKEEQEANLNLSSIVLRGVYKEQSFIFMGDAETENENERKWPKTNVLKIGHHGSNTSSSVNFLNQINPNATIISVGIDNKYGHPTKKTLNKLEKIQTTVYRTDELGTIILTSDGKSNKIVRK